MSTGPWLLIDTGDPTPPYEQLRRQLASLIGTGALADGERLPPVRQLAADLALAAGTVARAYRELESEGLIATRRGAGTRVRHSSSGSARDRRRALDQQAREFVSLAVALGSTAPEISAAVERSLVRTAPGA